MTLTKSKSRNSVSLYVTKSVRENGKKFSKVIEKLGTVAELEEKLNGQDPIQWAQEYVRELSRLEKEQKKTNREKSSSSILLKK